MSVLFVGTSISDFTIANSPVENTTAANIGPYVKEGVALRFFHLDSVTVC